MGRQRNIKVTPVHRPEIDIPKLVSGLLVLVEELRMRGEAAPPDEKAVRADSELAGSRATPEAGAVESPERQAS